MLFDISGAMMALQGWYNKSQALVLPLRNKREVGPAGSQHWLSDVQHVPPASSSDQHTEYSSDQATYSPNGNPPEVGPKHLYDESPDVQQVPPASSSEEPTEYTSDVDKDELIIYQLRRLECF